MSALFTRCPHCLAEVESGATTCPRCGSDIPVEKPSRAWIPALGLVALILAAAGAAIFLASYLHPKGKEVRTPDGEVYIQAPQRKIAEPQDIQTLLRVTALAGAPEERIVQVLADELGPTVKLAKERIAGYDQWVAMIFTPCLRNSNTRIEVMPYRGKVLFIRLRFETRHPNRAELLTLLGLEPHMAAPTVDAMEGPRWTCFPGVDEVRGVYDPAGGPGIREVTVTPNQFLADYFSRGGK